MINRRRTSITAGAVLALAVTGLTWSATGNAIPGAMPGSSASCPEAYPSADLTLDEQVTGLTSAGVHKRNGHLVDSSVSPEPFTGEFRGVVEDNVVGDILIFEMQGSRITKADGSVDAGIWAGMSGSPVYAADGRLVGAVAYGFSDKQGSNFAGVTPAANMYAQLGRKNGEAPISARVRLSTSERRALRSQGLPAAPASAGLVRLNPRPTLTGGRGQVSRKLRAAAPRSAGGGAATQSQNIALVPGGNVAFAGSRGSMGLFTVGTVTAVCGDEVLAYGHPNALGWGANTMHGASTTFVQANAGESYKLANLAAPVGSQTYDGVHGVNGRLAATPTGTEVVVNTRANGGPSTSTRSTVSDPYWTGSISAEQTARDVTAALGVVTKGSVRLSWTIEVTRSNGQPGTVSGSSTVNATEELPLAVGQVIFEQVEAIALNLVEPITVRRVSVNADASASLSARQLRTLEVRTGGTWKALPRSGRLKITGKPKPIAVRVSATSVVGSKLAPTSKVFTFTPDPLAKKVMLMASTPQGWEVEDKFILPTDWNSLVASLRPSPTDTVTVSMETNSGTTSFQTWRTGNVVVGQVEGGIRYLKPAPKPGKKKVRAKAGTKKASTPTASTQKSGPQKIGAAARSLR